MTPLRMIPPASVITAVVLTVACSRAVVMQPLIPENRQTGGTPARFGAGPVALADDGKRIEVRLERAASIAVLRLGNGEVEVLEVSGRPAGTFVLGLPPAGRWSYSRVSGNMVANPSYTTRCAGATQPEQPRRDSASGAAGNPPAGGASRGSDPNRAVECARVPQLVPAYTTIRQDFQSANDVIVVLVADGPLSRTRVRRETLRMYPIPDVVEAELPGKLGLEAGAWATWAVAR